MEKLYAKMQTFCDRFAATPVVNVVFTGDVGSGKTHLATCIYTRLLAEGYSALWTTAFGLGNLFLKNHTSLDKGSDIDALLGTDLLVIDDLGTEPLYRNVTLQYLYSVLNGRMLANKRTVITTNLTPEGIFDRYGERIFSRLNNKQSCVTVSMKGRDLRL